MYDNNIENDELGISYEPFRIGFGYKKTFEYDMSLKNINSSSTRVRYLNLQN